MNYGTRFQNELCTYDDRTITCEVVCKKGFCDEVLAQDESTRRDDSCLNNTVWTRRRDPEFATAAILWVLTARFELGSAASRCFGSVALHDERTVRGRSCD